jgi:two-component system, cell cycle sensor histidine kinase and response regulator CckA
MVIRSYAEILQDGFSPAEAAHRHTLAIMKATDRAAALTSQLLAFSRKQVLSPVPVILNDSIAEADKMLQRLLGEAIELRVKPEPMLWTVLADPDQLAQVLVNLSVNSRDAMPAGGVLTLQTRNVTADTGFIQRYPFFLPGDYAVLSVTDTGTGISAEVQERMFEPFFTTKGVGKGTGLGLSTVYGIVKQSGGYLLCDSRPGEGATFSMYLPRLSSRHAAGGAGGAGGDWLLRGRETILLVEDEDALRESIGHFLGDLGYSVLVAASGIEAQELAGRHEQPIHVLITDVLMPKMSGRGLAQALAASRPQMKTIYMSGYIEDDELRHGVLEEGTTFLQKPFSLGLLASKLRKLLG